MNAIHDARRHPLLSFILFAGPAVIVIGILIRNLNDQTNPGIPLIVAGLLLVAASILASHRINEEIFGPREGRNLRYEEQRFARRLRGSSLLFNAILILVLLAMIPITLLSFGVWQLGNTTILVSRVAGFLLLVLTINQVSAHYLSLRLPRGHGAHGMGTLVMFVGVLLGSLLAIAALIVTRTPLWLLDQGPLTDRHIHVLLLCSAFFLGVGVFTGRSLPGFYQVITEQREFYSGQSVLRPGDRGVFVPTVVAFSLLFLIVLILLLFGVGAAGLRQPIQLGIVVFIIATLLGSIAVSVRLAQSEDLSHTNAGADPSDTTLGRLILFGSVGAASILIGLALVLYLGRNVLGLGPGAWIDVFSVGLLLGLGPYGFYVHRRQQRIRRLEERFPDFLRDLAASHKGGLTLNAAIAISARGEYGELTPEIRKMADQLSWNLSFQETLELLAQRVQTPLIRRTVSLIIQAGKSGGNTSDVLLAAARDAREIKTLEDERRNNMTLYAIIVYLTFFVFLGIVATLYTMFVPELVKASQAAASATVSTGQVARLGTDIEDYRSLYFLAALVQGLGNGIIGGLMQTGRALAGLRHSFFMVFVSFVVFALLL